MRRVYEANCDKNVQKCKKIIYSVVDFMKMMIYNIRREGWKVHFDELFEMRKLIGIKLKDYIRGNGFSKVSFCKKTEISRPTLDKILNGEIDSKSTFDKHLNKIFTSLSISSDTLMGFSTKTQSVDAVCAQNALINYQMNDKAKMEYDLLQDILNLCSVYY